MFEGNEEAPPPPLLGAPEESSKSNPIGAPTY